MPLFSMEYVDSYGTLEEFAKNDGSYAIYKVASESDGPWTHYCLIRKAEDEIEMNSDPQIYNPVLVYNNKESGGSPTQSDIQQSWEHNHEGHKLLEQKLYTEALEEFDKAIFLNPTEGIFYCNKASAYIGVEEYEKAIVNCNKALELNSVNTRSKMYAYLNRSLAFKHLGRLNEAKADRKNANKARSFYSRPAVQGVISAIIVGIFFIGLSYAQYQSTSNNIQQQLSKIDMREYFPTATHTRLVYRDYNGSEAINDTTEDIFKMDESHYKLVRRLSMLKSPITSTYTVTKDAIIHKNEFGDSVTLTSQTTILVNQDKQKVEITGLNMKIKTPAGSFTNCIEVTAKVNYGNGDTFMKTYYAPKVGQVKKLVKIPSDPNYQDYNTFSELIEISIDN